MYMTCRVDGTIKETSFFIFFNPLSKQTETENNRKTVESFVCRAPVLWDVVLNIQT